MSARFERRLLGAFALLFLFAAQLQAQGKPYRGGELRTRKSYVYGRFEVRMKSAAGSGLLSSFFTYHDGDPDPIRNWNEIDIEILGRYSDQVQFNTITFWQAGHVHSVVVPFNPHEAFHEYAFEWTPSYVAWFVDGFEVYRQSGGHIAELRLPQKIMMNIWQSTATDWVGSFNPTVLPVYAFYDWVKFYSYTPETDPPFTLEWMDDYNQYDQIRWEKATHTFDGNNAQFTPFNIVYQDGYMILCLTTPSRLGYNGMPISDEDVDPPYVVWARAEPGRLLVYFSEPVDPGSATNLGNYNIPGVTPDRAELLADERTVALHSADVDLAKQYLVVVNHVRDRNGHEMGLQFTNASTALPLPIRINAGGGAAGDFLADSVWQFKSEYGHEGGQSRPGGGVQGVPAGAEAAFDAALEGLEFYRVRLAEGTYRLTLMFFEPEATGADQRVFNVWVEGEQRLSGVDLYAEAGRNRAVVKTIPQISVDNGVLDIYFQPVKGMPIVSALLIEPDTATGIGEVIVPKSHFLAVAPNPFRERTRIAFRLDEPGEVQLSLFNALGQKVDTVARGRHAAGRFSVPYQPRNLPTGLYFLQYAVDGRVLGGRKLIYLK